MIERRCPRCGGALFKDEDDLFCVNCGFRLTDIIKAFKLNKHSKEIQVIYSVWYQRIKALASK